MANSRRNGRLVDLFSVSHSPPVTILRTFAFFLFGGGIFVFLFLGRDSIALTKPSSQVDQLALGAAKREFRPLGWARPVHFSVANGANRLNHRTSRFSTWAISWFQPACSR